MGCLRSERPVVGAAIGGLLLTLMGCAHHTLSLPEMGTLESFRVPPPASHHQGTRFVVWGDSRSKGPEDLARDSKLRRCRRQLRDAIAAEDIDFVINTGDMVESGREELWGYFTEDAGSLVRPRFFFPVLGNHEYKRDDGDDLRHYFELFGPMVGSRRSYAFVHGDAYVIALDAFAQPRPATEDGEDNIHSQWLRAQLEEARSSRTLIVNLHYPVFSSGRNTVVRWLRGLVGIRPTGHHPPRWTAHLRDDLVRELADRRDRVPGARTLVFSGHSHFFEHYRFGGVEFIVTGGGGAPAHKTLAKRENRLAAHEGPHYVRVHLTDAEAKIDLVPVDCEEE